MTLKKRFDNTNLPAVIPDSANSLLADMQDSFDPLKGFNINHVDTDTLDQDSEIILISKDGGKFGICTEKFKVVKNDHGRVTIEKITDKDLDSKELIAEFIVSTHEQQIKDSVKEMVKQALIRKPIKTLRTLAKETKKKKGSKLHTRRGCVFFQIGNEAITL